MSQPPKFPKWKKEFFLEFGKDFAARGKSLDDKVTRKVLKKHFNIGLKILRIKFGTVSLGKITNTVSKPNWTIWTVQNW